MARAVVTDPNVKQGTPCFEGTRITVYSVLGFFTHADSLDEVFEEFPELGWEDIRAAVAYVVWYSDADKDMLRRKLPGVRLPG